MNSLSRVVNESKSSRLIGLSCWNRSSIFGGKSDSVVTGIGTCGSGSLITCVFLGGTFFYDFFRVFVLSESASRNLVTPLLPIRLDSDEFHLFLTALSVLPGRFFAIADHFPPSFIRRLKINSSSSGVHALFLMSGARWLIHRSLHCLGLRSGNSLNILDHEHGPCFATNSRMISSSSGVNGPLINCGFRCFSHRSCICWTVFLGSLGDNSFHFIPCDITKRCRILSSSTVQFLPIP